MRFIRNIFFLVIFIGVLYWVGIRYIIPQQVVRAINSGETSPIIPKKYEPALQKASVEINQEIENLPQVLAQNNVSYQDLYNLAETASSKNIKGVLEDWKTNQPENSDAAFDVVKHHFEGEMGNMEQFRGLFNEIITPERLTTGLNFLYESDLPLGVAVDLARNVGIEILRENNEKINSELEKIHSKSP